MEWQDKVSDHGHVGKVSIGDGTAWGAEKVAISVQQAGWLRRKECDVLEAVVKEHTELVPSIESTRDHRTPLQIHGTQY